MSWHRTQRSKKHRVCDACRQPIVPGERYGVFVCTPWGHPDNVGFINFCVCRFCAEECDEQLWLDDVDGKCFNEDYFVDYVREDWHEKIVLELGSDALIYPTKGLRNFMNQRVNWTDGFYEMADEFKEQYGWTVVNGHWDHPSRVKPDTKPDTARSGS